MSIRQTLSQGSLWLLLIASAGCGEAPAVPPDDPWPLENAGSQFDPLTCGTIRGRVTWQGDLPTVEPFTILPVAIDLNLKLEKQVKANVNAPVIDKKTRGVGNAVVFLRGVDPVRGRPWDLPPVTVAMKDQRFCIEQGIHDGRYGFVRRGEPVEMVSREQVPTSNTPPLHMLHAQGAAFFTLAFPDPEKPLPRRFGKNGVIELSSACTYYWMRAYLFVDDHPYYVRTAPDGKFALPDVPPGDYDLVCWMPNWHEAGRDLDPEMGILLRLFFRPPVETVRRITVAEGQTVEVSFGLTTDQFER
jgi:hypothetical protein